LKPSTRGYYAKRLFQFLRGEEPKLFIERALKNPRTVTIEIKGKVAETAAKHGASSAFHMRAAVKSFLDYYETGVHVNSKVKIRRKWQKPYLSWQDAERIIAKCREPYETVFRFMLWSGLGSDEVLEINSSAKIQADITKQVKAGKDYVIIDLEPRKQTLTRYFTAVPKLYLPIFPVHTLDYRIRGNKLITRQVLEDRFRKAARQVGLYELGMGPHTLRSVFTSQCAMAGVRESVCEFMKGHGAGDKYGYSREVLNEDYVVKELRKLWAPTIVTKDALDQRDKTIEQLQTELNALKGQFETILKGKVMPIG
ncbi:MAG: hypothetical protein WB643_12935, partial [Candidatus Bathyarchaeia archaeon]